jgi:uncharacterized membrane protein
MADDMSEIQHSVRASVPVATLYNQWTLFEEFPSAMPGVAEVRQLDDDHVRVVLDEAGRRLVFTAAIGEQVPEQHVEWRATGDVPHAGRADFAADGDGASLTVRLRFDGPHVASLARPRLAAALTAFAQDVDRRGRESGGWRGKIEGGEVTSSAGG